jgi:hypothetical protein
VPTVPNDAHEPKLDQELCWKKMIFIALYERPLRPLLRTLVAVCVLAGLVAFLWWTCGPLVSSVVTILGATGFAASKIVPRP